MARRVLGRIREQPPGQVLQAHRGRAPAVRSGSRRMEARRGGHCACATGDLTMSYFRNLIARKDVERELDEELQSYIELLTAEKIKGGMQPDEARRAARLEAGGVEQIKEEVRDARSGALIETTVRDLKYEIGRAHV